MDVNDILQLIISAEFEAAGIMRQAHDIITQDKTCARDVVTEYDRKVQSSIIERITSVLPEAHFFCEENNLTESLCAEHVFVVDPIDGTMNFVRGFWQSCISVAYMNLGVLKAGAVYNPRCDELFSASVGNGAFLNGRQIHCSSESLHETVCCVGTTPYNPELSAETFSIMKLLFDNSLDIRREGSAAIDLCSIACGRGGLFYEALLSFWDFAAGSVIAREAGAEICSVDGSPLVVDGSRTSVLAGAPKAVRDFLCLKT